MAVKRRTRKETNGSKPVLLRNRTDLAWKNFTLFLIIFLFSFVLYNITTDGGLLNNFFYLLSIILGFLTLALLIAFVVLFILKSGKK